MIRKLVAKPALLVLGTAILAVFGLSTLVVLFVALQGTRAAQHPATPAAFQQFDESAQQQSVATNSDSPEGAYASMPQSGEGTGQQNSAAESRSFDSYDSEISSASPNARPAQYSQVAQYAQPAQDGQPAQYGQSAQYSHASYGSAAGGWTGLVAPDGSATVSLPANWHIAGGGKGVVAVEGPNSEQVVLGLQTFVTSNQAPYMAPEQALAWFMRSHGIQLVGVQQHEAQQSRTGQAELIVGESEMQGRKYKFVARVTTAQIGMGNWMLQVSSMGAPVEQFDAEFPTMQKIWNSWNLDPSYVRNAFQAAATMNQQTAAMVANGAMARFNGWKPFHADMDQTLRGVTTMENSTLGNRVETPIGTERQYLNNCARNGQDCRQVPMNELPQ